jgi:hypothetical protein
MKKTVTFSKNLEQVRYFQRDSPTTLLNNVNIAKGSILSFLNSDVEDIIHTAGKHFTTLRSRNSPKSDVDWRKVGQKIVASMITLMKPMPISEALVELVNKFMQQHMDKSVAWVVGYAIKNPSDKAAHYTSLVLLQLGLETFFNFNHCENECYRAARYSDTEDVITITKFGKQNNKLVNACLDAHAAIQDALGTDDIRLFDKLLRKASGNKCSLVKERGAVGGGKNKLHVGPRGGTYIMEAGKKKYIQVLGGK